ncbi:hypothetical protein GYB22_04425 [bacterium]|nr:hypothetical protein [bacterium]
MVTRLQNCQVESKYYFFDANVWLYALQGDDIALERWEENYSDFLYSVVESDLDPKPKILMPAILYSEILNVYLKKIKYNERLAELGMTSQDYQYKRDFRGSAQYNESIENLYDDISAISDSILFVGDDILLNNNDPLYFEPGFGSFDFADYFYSKLCHEISNNHDLSIVTNDGDFDQCPVHIITSNRNIIRARQ